ncbi:MAG: peptide chain release factor N(5)-glutamine methyltransferase [Armatimonadetes bacterium]|nr:peptide chain release factor N(5)-glutamine methyltransferase [Armatimonadota bacterium]
MTTNTTWALALADATARLAAAGLDEPEVDAALLLGHVVSASRTMVRLFADRLLDPAQATALERLVARRLRREPLPYVLGYQEFMGLRFACDQRALVPRWDTEALAERAIAALRAACARRPEEQPCVADIGTGSGILAVTLAHEVPRARVWATDRSAPALALAAENAAALGVAARVIFAEGHLAGPLPRDVAFAGIVANLPYIPSGELSGLQPEVRDWEPTSALDGGADGLDLLRELATAAPAYLSPRGWLLLEHADDQSDAVRDLLAERGYADLEVVRDLAGRDRAVWGVWRP